MRNPALLAALVAAAAVVSPARATVPSTCSSSTQTGNGVTTAFTFACKFLQNADISVTVAGVTKTQGTDYAVTGAGNASGTITFVTAPANAAAVIITRTVDYKQERSLRQTRTYDPATVENAIDKIAMGEQQLQNLYTNPPASILPANVVAKLNNIRFADQFANIQAAITDAGTTGAVIIPSSYAAGDTYTNPNNIVILDLRVTSASTGFNLRNLNALRFATLFSTIQAAISDAGTTGAVVIPSSYAGSDSFTNPNSIPIIDLRGGPSGWRGFLSAKDFGAKCNNSADDYAAINSALSAASSTKAMLIFPGGTCITQSQITVPSNVTMFGYGTKLKFSNTAANDVVLNVNAVSRVTIMGFEIDGQKASVATVTEFKHGIQVMSSTDVTLRDIYSHDNKGDGLYFGAGSGQPVNQRIFVENYRSDASYRNALSITNMNGGRFVGFVGTGSNGTAPKDGLDIEPNFDADTVTNIEFFGCEFSGNTGVGISVLLRQTPSNPQRNIHFTNCVSSSNTDNGAYLYFAVHTSFTGGTIELNGQSGVVIDRNATDITITDTIIRKNQQRGIAAIITATYTARRLRFLNNRILDNGQVSAGTLDGIKIDGTADDILVSGNELSNVEGATQRYGISTGATTVTGLRVLGNTATANTIAGSLFADDPLTRLVSGNSGIPNGLFATSTWDPANIVAGASTSVDVTLTGARQGDSAQVTFTNLALPNGITLTAQVTANDTVRVTLGNLSGGAYDAASSTLRVAVTKY